MVITATDIRMLVDYTAVMKELKKKIKADAEAKAVRVAEQMPEMMEEAHADSFARANARANFEKHRADLEKIAAKALLSKNQALLSEIETLKSKLQMREPVVDSIPLHCYECCGRFFCYECNLDQFRLLVHKGWKPPSTCPSCRPIRRGAGRGAPDVQNVMLKCCDCPKQFCFNERDRTIVEQKGWDPPKRCPSCRPTGRGGGRGAGRGGGRGAGRGRGGS